MRAFDGCEALTSIDVAEGKANYASIDGVLYDKEKKTIIRCPQTKTSIEIPNSVTEIGNSAFKGCKALTSITIPNSVTTIGDWAFYRCRALTSIEIPDSVTKIGEFAFERCEALEKAEFASIESLCSISFNDYYSNPLELAHHLYINGQEVTNLIIPNGVTSIGYCAFKGYKALTSIKIPNSVTEFGKHAFEGCSALTSIEIPDSVTNIGDCAFSECEALTSIEIPNSVTKIGGYAFWGCEALTSITIPDSATEIPAFYFYDYRGLKIVCEATTPPIFNTYRRYKKTSLYVPKESIKAYKKTDGWRNFKKIKAIESLNKK